MDALKICRGRVIRETVMEHSDKARKREVHDKIRAARIVPQEHR